MFKTIIMKISMVLLTILVLTSCIKSSKDSTNEPVLSNIQNTLIDTLLGKHRTVIRMDEFALTNGVENEIQIKINNIEAKNIVVYTSTSEATLRVGKQLGTYALTPKRGVNQVTITVNYLGSEGIVKLGRVTLNTVHTN